MLSPLFLGNTGSSPLGKVTSSITAACIWLMSVLADLSSSLNWSVAIWCCDPAIGNSCRFLSRSGYQVPVYCSFVLSHPLRISALSCLSLFELISHSLFISWPLLAVLSVWAGKFKFWIFRWCVRSWSWFLFAERRKKISFLFFLTRSLCYFLPFSTTGCEILVITAPVDTSCVTVIS